tara:strand:+ start:3593 stop:3739 length:147 start_codon:yes stop_codon:yes gene_type:complete
MKEIFCSLELKLIAKFQYWFDSKNAGDTISFIFDILRRMTSGVLSDYN